MAVRRLAEQQPSSFVFSQDNQAWAEQTIAKFPEGRQASAVIPLLWRAQEQEGWITKPAMESVGAMLGMPLIRVLEVATFYTMFHLEPVGTKAHVQVCGTTPCMLRGSGELIDVCRRRIHERPHHVSANGAFSWEEVECLGACVNAPMVQIGKDNYEDLTADTLEVLLDAFSRGERPRPGPQNQRKSSEPISGLTSLTDIAYADDEVSQPDNRDFRPTGAGDAAVPDHGAANLEADDPRQADFAGGEQFESEQLRRKGRMPEPPTDGAERVSPEVANQTIAGADSVGRSDQAASGAMGARSVEGDANLPGEPRPDRLERRPDGRTREEPGPRSDRDSASGDKEG
jgi:NADH-quinone oxidoreductase subunit E